MELNKEHKEILLHTIKNGLFCGDSKEMAELCEAGLMEYAGKKSFVPDPYYRITDAGKKAALGKGRPVKPHRSGGGYPPGGPNPWPTCPRGGK